MRGLRLVATARSLVAYHSETFEKKPGYGLLQVKMESSESYQRVGIMEISYYGEDAYKMLVGDLSHQTIKLR